MRLSARSIFATSSRSNRLYVFKWRKTQTVFWKLFMIPWVKLKIYGSRTRIAEMWKSRNDNSDKDSTSSKTSTRKSDHEKIQMSILAEEGLWNAVMGVEYTVEKVKGLALTHFYNASESQKLAPKYRLVSVSEKRTLPNNSTLLQEGIKNHDEVLLLECYSPQSKESAPVDAQRGPTVAQITTATHALTEKNVGRKSPRQQCAVDFQHEVRRILMSLCEASARILSPTPDSDRVIALIQEQMTARRLSEMNPASVKTIVDMGYTRDQAIRALKKKNLNHRDALEWLSEHANDPDDEMNDMPSTSHGSQGSQGASSQSLVQAVESMLTKFRAAKKEEFRPNMRALQTLKEMGFKETDAQEALRITGNNQNAACEWLLGDRRPSLQDLDEGLDPNSAIYQAIMDNASVQLSLNNPRMLLAFLSMLDNPGNAELWLSDPEAAPVLNTIFKIYHSEKHSESSNS